MAIIQEYVSLQPVNTFGVAAVARAFTVIDDVGRLREIIREPLFGRLPHLIVGEGSNILFTCDYPGLVLHSRIKGIAVVEENDRTVIVRAGSGEKWDDFVRYCVDNKYYGAENLSLIPGTVGAAAVQNIGAYGTEASEVITIVNVFDLETGKKLKLSNNECRFGYRTSIFKTLLKDRMFITSVDFRLLKTPGFNLSYPQLAREAAGLDVTQLKSLRDSVIAIRRRKLPDPDEVSNAGSFFKNPVMPKGVADTLTRLWPEMPRFDLPDGKIKIPAAWLIEQCGWKGKQSGHCGTWKQHALVIVNYGNASGKDILDFSENIRKDVKRRFGITLEREVLVL